MKGFLFANLRSGLACVSKVLALLIFKVLGGAGDVRDAVALGSRLTGSPLVPTLLASVFVDGILRTSGGRRCRIPELSSGKSENLTFLRLIVLWEDFVGDRDLVQGFKLTDPVLLLFVAVRFEVRFEVDVGVDVGVEDEVVKAGFFFGILYEARER